MRPRVGTPPPSPMADGHGRLIAVKARSLPVVHQRRGEDFRRAKMERLRREEEAGETEVGGNRQTSARTNRLLQVIRYFRGRQRPWLVGKQAAGRAIARLVCKVKRSTKDGEASPQKKRERKKKRQKTPPPPPPTPPTAASRCPSGMISTTSQDSQATVAAKVASRPQNIEGESRGRVARRYAHQPGGNWTSASEGTLRSGRAGLHIPEGRSRGIRPRCRQSRRWH